MDLNYVFFPAPKDRYSCASHFNEMYYLPKVIPSGGGSPYIAFHSPKNLQEYKSSLTVVYIPCLYM